MAVYHAWEKGMATYAFADPALNRRYEIANEIEAVFAVAIANGDVRGHSQPKVLLADFTITGQEALSRWEHPQMGKASTADLIPVAKKKAAQS